MKKINNEEASWKVLLNENPMLKCRSKIKTIKKTNKDGQYATYEYEDGLLIKKTDWYGESITYEYEDGLLVKKTYWCGLYATYDYEDGLLVKKTYWDGWYATYEYVDGLLVASKPSTIKLLKEHGAK